MADRKAILQWCERQSKNAAYLTIPEDIFKSLNTEMSNLISTYFNNNILIKLPEREIRFFEWLKENDRPVWDDLWGQTDEEPYLVGISFLSLLVDKLTGFPICDLMEIDNYYFTKEHIIDKEAKIFLESIHKRFEEKEQLTLQQALMLQISVQPTDVWHFAYHFSTNLNATKAAAEELASDKMLIHITNAEHLTPFIKF
jgi:hypothetical protein